MQHQDFKNTNASLPTFLRRIEKRYYVSKIFFFFILAAFTIVTSSVSYAQVINSVSDCDSVDLGRDNEIPPGELETGHAFGTVNPIAIVCPIVKLLNVVMLTSGAVFVMVVLMASYRYATSTGDPKATQGAKNTLTYAIIGFLIVIGTYTIIRIIGGIFGLDPSSLTPAGPFDSFISAVKDLLCLTEGIEGIGC